MKACLFSGVRACSRLFAIETLLVPVATRRFDFDGGGKAVMVCEVEVLEDVVLPGLAIVAGSKANIVVANLKILNFSYRV